MFVKVVSTDVMRLASDELLVVASDCNWVVRCAKDDDVFVRVVSTDVIRLDNDELLAVTSDCNWVAR